jgi:hypothetical protein
MFSPWGAFRKGAEITLITPDLDNASEGRKNTRLRVTPELFCTMQRNRTLQQLKNSGALRLLNAAHADSITIYVNTLRSLEKNETTEVQETQTLLRNITYELVNFPIAMNARDHDTDTAKSNKATLLYGSNPVLLNKYFNVLYHYTGLMHGQVYYFQKLLSRATSLIFYLKKENHLK